MEKNPPILKGLIRKPFSKIILLILLSLMFLAVIAYLVYGISPLMTGRLVGGLLLLLFLPGFVVCQTLFPDKGELDSVEKIGLSFGLSIPLVLFVILIADLVFHLSLTPPNIILSILGAIVSFLVIVALYNLLKSRTLNKPKNIVQ